MAKFEKVGRVSVDAGMIWIGDPCYILHRGDDARPAPPEIGTSWPDFVGRLYDDGPAWKVKCLGTNFGLGVVVSSGGDGSFPVFVEKDDEGNILGARIQFLRDPAPSDPDPLAEAARLLGAMLPAYCPACSESCIEATCIEAREFIESYRSMRRGRG